MSVTFLFLFISSLHSSPCLAVDEMLDLVGGERNKTSNAIGSLVRWVGDGSLGFVLLFFFCFLSRGGTVVKIGDKYRLASAEVAPHGSPASPRNAGGGDDGDADVLEEGVPGKKRRILG